MRPEKTAQLLDALTALIRAGSASEADSTGVCVCVQYQKLAMKRFCADHPSRGAKPPKGTRQNQDLYKHLLYNDETKIIFCYIPKSKPMYLLNVRIEACLNEWVSQS